LEKNNDKETLSVIIGHFTFFFFHILLVMAMASVPNKAAVFRSIARSRRSSRRFQANRQIPDGVLRDILVRNESRFGTNQCRSLRVEIGALTQSPLLSSYLPQIGIDDEVTVELQLTAFADHSCAVG
jgi:hypothetical protein